MSVNSKKVFMWFSFTNNLVTTRIERKITFYVKELYHKKLLHCSENVVQIYEKGPPLLMRNNVNLAYFLPKFSKDIKHLYHIYKNV